MDAARRGVLETGGGHGRAASSSGADREPSSARSGHEGEKAPEGPTPKPIAICCEPRRLAVRGLGCSPAAMVRWLTI